MAAIRVGQSEEGKHTSFFLNQIESRIALCRQLVFERTVLLLDGSSKGSGDVRSVYLTSHASACANDLGGPMILNGL